MVKLHAKALIESQLKEMQSTKVIKTLWVRWKKPMKLVITLDSEDVTGAQDKGGNINDNYIRVEMLFKILMTEFYEGNDSDELIQHTFAHINT